MINGFLRSYLYSLSFSVDNSSQLTKGRPKPKKVYRKNVGEKLAETTVTRPFASPPCVPTPRPSVQNAMALAATPSQTPVTAPPTHDVGPTSHADAPTQLCAHQSTSKADKPSVNTDKWNERALIGVRSSDPTPSATPNLQGKPFLVGIAHHPLGTSISSSSPQKPLQAQPSSASPRSPRRLSRIPSTGSRTLVMDVARALQDAQATTAEAEVTSKSPISFAAPRQVELPALPTEKRKSGSDKYPGHVMSLQEGPGVDHELVEVDINANSKRREQTCPDNLPPVQDTSCIEIREWPAYRLFG
jgi:hypothetical protein